MYYTFMFVSYESGNVVHRGEMQLTIVEKSVQLQYVVWDRRK
jgi:hypothetical protein